MLNIYIARHGQNIDNANGILNGHRDLPLTELGRSQALSLAIHIKESRIAFDAIYSSPLVRSFETAQIVTNMLSLSEPIADPIFIERNFGIMTGGKVADIEKMCAPHILKTDVITYFTICEGAETFDEMLARGGKAINFIQERYKDGNMLVVGHGDFGKMMYAAYYDLEPEKVLTMFHFGNSELIKLSPDSSPDDVHVFQQEQFNH